MHWKFYLYIILLNIAQAVVFLPGAKAMDNRNQLSIRSPEHTTITLRREEERRIRARAPIAERLPTGPFNMWATRGERIDQQHESDLQRLETLARGEIYWVPVNAPWKKELAELWINFGFYSCARSAGVPELEHFINDLEDEIEHGLNLQIDGIDNPNAWDYLATNLKEELKSAKQLANEYNITDNEELSRYSFTEAGIKYSNEVVDFFSKAFQLPAEIVKVCLGISEMINSDLKLDSSNWETDDVDKAIMHGSDNIAPLIIMYLLESFRDPSPVGVAMDTSVSLKCLRSENRSITSDISAVRAQAKAEASNVFEAYDLIRNSLSAESLAQGASQKTKIKLLLDNMEAAELASLYILQAMPKNETLEQTNNSDAAEEVLQKGKLLGRANNILSERQTALNIEMRGILPELAHIISHTEEALS
jgi:hypothetical protein